MSASFYDWIGVLSPCTNRPTPLQCLLWFHVVAMVCALCDVTLCMRFVTSPSSAAVFFQFNSFVGNRCSATQKTQ